MIIPLLEKIPLNREIAIFSEMKSLTGNLFPDNGTGIIRDRNTLMHSAANISDQLYLVSQENGSMAIRKRSLESASKIKAFEGILESYFTGTKKDH